MQPQRLLGLALLALGGVLLGVVAAWLNVEQIRMQRADSTSRLVAAQDVLGSSLWRELRLTGHLPLIVGEQGRSDPFRAGTVSPATAEGRDAIRVRDILALSSALKWHVSDAGRYPVARVLPLGTSGAACLSERGWTDAGGCVGASHRYLEPVPQDPGQGSYRYTSDGYYYTINVELEAAPGTLASWEYRGDRAATP